MRVIEVFADVGCPFTHVGLRRFVERRADEGLEGEVALRVRSWPLEIVNGTPLDARFIAEEVDDIRRQVAPDLFGGFREDRFPSTFVPAMMLAAAADRVSPKVGEDVSLTLRDLLFEQGVDVSDPAVLVGLAEAHGITVDLNDPAPVLADHAEGVERGVVGSPHFFTPDGTFFCPSLNVGRDDSGHLRVTADPAGFQQFLSSCLA
jgi:predicted DsbA family dithiol-disulfide isomerase